MYQYRNEALIWFFPFLLDCGDILKFVKPAPIDELAKKQKKK